MRENYTFCNIILQSKVYDIKLWWNNLNGIQIQFSLGRKTLLSLNFTEKKVLVFPPWVTLTHRIYRNHLSKLFYISFGLKTKRKVDDAHDATLGTWKATLTLLSSRCISRSPGYLMTGQNITKEQYYLVVILYNVC